MGIYDKEVMKTVSRRSMTIFFLVDTSGSMFGEKIGALNQAIEEAIPELNGLSASNADAIIKVATLKFSSGAEWITSTPIDVDQFSWTPLGVDGLTDFGEACFKLEQKLHKEEFMNDAAGCFAPVFILLSDGVPTDNYTKHLDNLKKNNWFKKGIRIAISIGDDADKDMLKEFTGNPETVITVYSPETLRKVIRFVSVTASQVASKSSSVGNNTGTDQVKSKQDEFVETLKAEQEEGNLLLEPATDDGSDGDNIEW